MTRRSKFAVVLSTILAASLPTAAWAGASEEVKAINDSWAHITYQMNGSSHQTVALDKLADQAAAVAR